MPTVITYDTENIADWASREVVTDVQGQLISTTTIYDTGISIAETTWRSEQGAAITRLDLEDVMPWESYTTKPTHWSGLSGFTDITLFDNGILRQDISVGNFEYDYRQISERDTADIKNWTSWSKEYDGRHLTEFVIYFDNGVEEQNFYDPRADHGDSRYLLDRSDIFSWDYKRYEYDPDGELASTKVVQDNGNYVEKVFDAGVLTETTFADVADQSSWSEIVTVLEDDQKVARTTTYDNGVVRSELWEDGQRTLTEQVDSANIKSWDHQATYFNVETGQIEQITVGFDNGVQRDTLYENGQRSIVETTDVADAFAWETKTSFYQPDGKRTGSETQMDNGDRFISNYDVADQYRWSEIVTALEDGQKVARTTTYDNGVVRSELWGNGQRSTVETTDVADAFAWETKTSFYQPDGGHSSSEIQMDNGDRIIFKYQEDDGQRDYRIEVDGDNSQSWGYRVTEYDVDGINPVVTTYNTITDLPSPYIDDLG